LNLLTWQIVRRASTSARDWPLPPAILTARPPFSHESLPTEIGLLLPNTVGAGGFVAAVAAAPDRLAGRALGLFLADPFLNVPGEVAGLRAAGVAWVANLPSVEQQDVDFAQQLEDVGLDFAREVDRLSQFRRAGLQVIAAVAGVPAATAVRLLAPQAVVVVPRIADFAAGFPSFRRRGALAREVKAALGDWAGPLLGLATADEAAHETLWPDVLDGVLCRPQPLPQPDAIP
jgi:hypothetical protein